MADELGNRATTTSDEVWKAWIAKNREAERILNRRIARIAIASVVALGICATVWLTAVGRI